MATQQEWNTEVELRLDAIENRIELRFETAQKEFGEMLVTLGERIDHLGSRIAALDDRITESERAMTQWIETYMQTTRALLETEEQARRGQVLEVGRGVEGLTERVRLIEDGPIESIMSVLGDLQTAVGRLQKEAVGVDDVLAHTEHSEDRRRLNAKQNAKGDWQLDATVELFGSDNHVVAQELARLVDEGRREMRAEVEEPAAV